MVNDHTCDLATLGKRFFSTTDISFNSFMTHKTIDVILREVQNCNPQLQVLVRVVNHTAIEPSLHSKMLL